MELLGLYDQAAEINVTPDRSYCFSIRGAAREYAHATGTAFTDPVSKVQVPEALSGGYGVKLNDDAPIYGKPGCDRFVARTVRGVDATRPTPPWMTSRLRLAGIRSISLPVDISNYVMLELGQPNHCYDLDKLAGDIVVRRATAGEKITTLDDKERTLDVEDLLITDESGPIGIAGVMGGAHTEVSDATTNVLVEAAHFDEVSIARARRRHKLPSEASKRFERGVDWQVADVAAQRVVDLLVELAGGTADEAGTDVGTAPDAVTIELPAEYAAARIGIDFTEEQILTSLEDLGAVVAKTGNGYTVTAPSWRHDLETKDDLTEEIARLVGYDKIPATLPVAPPGRGLTRVQQQRRRLIQALADAGLTEVLAYPFVSKAANDTFGVPAEGAERKALKLANPISEEHGFLRTSVLPGLIEVAKRNHSRGFRDLALFEAGLVFLPGRPAWHRRDSAARRQAQRRGTGWPVRRRPGPAAAPRRCAHGARLSCRPGPQPRGPGTGRTRWTSPGSPATCSASNSWSRRAGTRPSTRAGQRSLNCAPAKWWATPASCTRSCWRHMTCRPVPWRWN